MLLAAMQPAPAQPDANSVSSPRNKYGDSDESDDPREVTTYATPEFPTSASKPVRFLSRRLVR